MPQNPLPAPPTDLADFEEVKTELNILLSENVVIPRYIITLPPNLFIYQARL